MEPDTAVVTTAKTAEEIVLQRRIDRALAYIKMKMDTAMAVNHELDSTRTQIAQMTAFVLIALVLGTGGLQSFLDWNRNILLLSASTALLVLLISSQVTRVSNRYTDIIMDEFHAFETLYGLVVWENVDDMDALSRECSAVEQGTREAIDAENRTHPLLLGTILHSMIHFERHSEFPEDIGSADHSLPITGESGHR